MRGTIQVEKMLYTSNFSPWKIWSFVQIGWFWNPWSAPLSGLAVAKVCCGFARTSLHHLWITALKFDRNPKKMGLDHELWSNFRPTSNHPFFYTKRAAFWNQVFQAVQMFFSGCAVCVSPKKNSSFWSKCHTWTQGKKDTTCSFFRGRYLAVSPPQKKIQGWAISSSNLIGKSPFSRDLFSCSLWWTPPFGGEHPSPPACLGELESSGYNNCPSTSWVVGISLYLNHVILHLFYIPSLELT